MFDVGLALRKLGYTQKVTSTVAYQAFRKVNLDRRRPFWTRPWPVGIHGILRRQLIDDLLTKKIWHKKAYLAQVVAEVNRKHLCFLLRRLLLMQTLLRRSILRLAFKFGMVDLGDVVSVHQHERDDLGIGRSVTTHGELLVAVVNVAGNEEDRHGNRVQLPLPP